MVKSAQVSYCEVVARALIAPPNDTSDAKKPKSPKPPRDRKAAELGEHIGKELRAMFQDVVAEPVPEKFQKLLDELERKRSGS